MKSLPAEYKGKYIALINKRIVSSGKNSLEAYNKAKKSHLKGMVTLMYIPTKKETVTFLYEI